MRLRTPSAKVTLAVANTNTTRSINGRLRVPGFTPNTSKKKPGDFPLPVQSSSIVNSLLVRVLGLVHVEVNYLYRCHCVGLIRRWTLIEIIAWAAGAECKYD